MSQFPIVCPFEHRLDHDLYDHRRTLLSPAASWPQERHVAAFFLLRLETLELEPPVSAQRDPRWSTEFGSFLPPYRMHSLMEYGNRIGVFRLLDLLQPLGWHVAVSVNGLIAHENPWLVRHLQERGVSLVASGWSASRMLSNALDASTRRQWLQQSLDALSQASGTKAEVYASQDYGYSSNCTSVLAELGVQTTIDWPNDEQPFWFGQARDLVNLPVLAELEDSQMVVNRKLQTPAWIRQLRLTVESWSAMGRPGSVMALPLHAWIAGVPHRYTQLQELMGELEVGSFWHASPAEIASYWRKHVGQKSTE